MANWEVGPSSLMDSYKAMKTSEHQRPAMLFKPAISPEQTLAAPSPCHMYASMNKQANPVAIRDIAYATQQNGSLNTNFAVTFSNSQGKTSDYGIDLMGKMQTLAAPSPCKVYASMNKQANPVAIRDIAYATQQNGSLNTDFAITFSNSQGKTSDYGIDLMGKMLTLAAPSPCNVYASMNKQGLAVKVLDSQGKASKDSAPNLMGDMDAEEMRKLKKRQQNREYARKSKIRKKNELEELQARIRAISHETSVLRNSITIHSEEILELESENKALLEELRDVCDEETLSRLESMNPENSSQKQQNSHESGPSNVAAPSSE